LLNDPTLPLSVAVSANVATTLSYVTTGDNLVAGNSMIVELEITDDYGNRRTADSTTVTFTPSGNGRIEGVNVSSSNDGAFATAGAVEAIGASSGLIQLSLTNTVAETFTLTATSAGLTDAPVQTIVVSPADPAQLVVSAAPVSFEAGQSTTLSLKAQDVYGNDTTTATSNIVFTPSGNGRIETGSDGLAFEKDLTTGAVTVTVADNVAETMTIDITNGTGLTNPSSPSVVVTPGSPSQLTMHLH
jgi:hypothetical protein